MNDTPELTWQIHGLPRPVLEYRFHPERKWRLDYAWVDRKVAVEVEGGVWMRAFGRGGGAHSRPANIVRDMEKYNAAGLLGWRVFRFQPRDLKTGKAQEFMREVFK